MSINKENHTPPPTTQAKPETVPTQPGQTHHEQPRSPLEEILLCHTEVPASNITVTESKSSRFQTMETKSSRTWNSGYHKELPGLSKFLEENKFIREKSSIPGPGSY